MRHAPLHLIVFLGGAAVLSLEILGTRILGPFYGVSLFLWSALITVTLAALSLGYLLGGRMADRDARYSVLGVVLGLAGLWTLAVPWLKYPVLHLTEPLGLRAAVLLTSTILFFPPLTLLGMVSPYAIRLRARSLDEVGRTAGDLYAVSTLASVLAALLTGFVLIPNVGVFRLVLLIGAVLLAGSAVAFLAGGRRPGGITAAVLVLGAGTMAWSVPGEQAKTDEGLLAVRQSPYAEIRVVDWEDTRYLLIDGGGHTVVEPGTWKSFYPYVKVLDIAKFLFEEPGDLLLLGLGGGSVAKSFSASNWDVDVVEIDPVVVDVAREFFGFEDGDGVVHTMDARQYLLTHDTRYDLIIMDAFGSSSIPFHLVTREAFALIRERLKPEGVLCINYEAVGWHDQITAALTATVGTAFSEVLTLPLSEPPNTLGNLVLMAANRPLDFPEDMLGRPYDFLADAYRHWEVVERNHAWNNRFRENTEGVPVLTDDRNPVDLWAERINLEARKVLHSQFAWAHLEW